MNIPLLLHTLGNLIILLAGIMLVPLGIAIYYKTGIEIRSFILSIATALIVGSILRFSIKAKDVSLGPREGFGIVAFGWLFCALFGALPYWYAGACESFTDAYFESMSGFTTTGASILRDVETLPKGISFWRCLTQWLGGMGIVVFFVAILPALKVGGYHLFGAEASGLKVDKIKPRIAETAKLLWFIYLSLSCLLAIFLYLGGMSPFETICHTFTIMSTGGFSTRNASIAAFNSLYIEVVTIVFMFLAACNFVLYYYCLRREINKILKDSELRFFISLVSASILIVTLFLYFNYTFSYKWGVKVEEYSTFFRSLRYAAFQVVSIISATGHCSADFDIWPDICRSLLIFLMLVGGCAGSTAGGMKIVRLLFLIKYSLRELERLIRPSIVKHIKINEVSVDEDIIKNSLAFSVSYMGIFLIASLVLVGLGTDIMTSFSAVASTMGNVGPGLAEVGPAKNYADIPFFGKWVLIFCMLVGRLEIYCVLLLFLPVTWKR